MAEVVTGRIVRTPGAERPYKAIVERAGEPPREIPVDTIAEGESILKREGAVSRDRPPEDWHL